MSLPAPTSLGWVTYKQVKPVSEEPYYHFYVAGGIFYHPNIPPGSYRMATFGGFNGWTNTRYTFQVPRQTGGETRARIEEPGIHFVGIFRYKPVDTGFFEPGRYSLEMGEKPGEKKVLQKLLEDAKGTSWEARIRARLRAL